MSVDYYTRLEQGKETRPSRPVVDSIARALGLEPAEHEHLAELALRAASRPPVPPRVPGRTLAAGTALLLEQLRPFPAHVLGRSMDVIAANPGGLGLLAGMADWPAAHRNIARYVFLHPGARRLFSDWENQVRGCVGTLRAAAGKDPDAPDLTNLVGELLLKSPDFARLWKRYDVRGHSRREKTFQHPQVGSLTLGYQALQVRPRDRR